jgi:hypothetical protein
LSRASNAGSEAGFSLLRRDGETLDLLMLETCAVGASAPYWIQVDDAVPA